MPRFRIVVAYDGGGFVGWQRQPAAAGSSIQGLLEDALGELDGNPVTVLGAGRTDAGVHALGQVAAFTLARAIAADVVVRALNVRLPDSVRVLTAEQVPESFNPRHDARAKTYRYRIWHGDVMNPLERCYAWHIFGPLDVEAMQAAARLLEGRHDFSAFQGSGSDVQSTVREVIRSRVMTTGATGDAESTENTEGTEEPVVARDGTLVTYEISGDGFLRHMVRAIVGTLVEIGRGRWSAEAVREILASRDRAAAGPTAPAQGLFLVRVHY